MSKSLKGSIAYDTLRSSIRLLHCLQKERGVSCIFSARSKSKEDYVESEGLVDEEISSLGNSCIEESVSSKDKEMSLLRRNNERTLRKVSSLDRSLNNLTKTSGTGKKSHYLALEWARNSTDAAMFSLKSVIHNMSSTTLAEEKQQVLTLYDIISSKLLKARSITDDSCENSIDKPKEQYMTDFVSTFDAFSDVLKDLVIYSCDLIMEEHSNRYRHRKLDIHKRKEKRTLSCLLSETLDNFELYDEYSALLSLLMTFIQVKERTGLQRGQLLGLKALPEETINLISDFSTIFHRMILGVEAEKRCKKTLERCVQRMNSSVYEPLSHFVLESMHLPEKMSTIVDNLLKNFSIEPLRQGSISDISIVWTLFMDRLHATELLILEEIEPLMTVVDPKSGNYSAFNSVYNSKNKNITTRLDNEANISGSSSHPFIHVVVEEEDCDFLLEDAFHFEVVDTRSSMKAHHKVEDKLETSEQDSPSTSIIEETKIEEGWGIPLTEVKFLKKIGVGGASTNYLAKWQGEKVCVKVASVTKIGLDGWRTEVDSLQRLHHPNIIRLLGTIYNADPLTCCLVLDYCNLGDLGTVLDNEQLYPTLPKDCFIRVAEGIACGMKFLHSRNVLHRDIKPANVLLSGEFVAGKYKVMLTDFGVAKFSKFQSIETGGILEDTEMTAETGTYRYMAPEVIRHEHYSFQADVYSYALVLWQLFTRYEPFFQVDSVTAAKLVALENARPQISDGVPRIASSFIEKCWADPPSSRPSFAAICKELIELKPLFEQK